SRAASEPPRARGPAGGELGALLEQHLVPPLRLALRVGLLELVARAAEVRGVVPSLPVVARAPRADHDALVRLPLRHAELRRDEARLSAGGGDPLAKGLVPGVLLAGADAHVGDDRLHRLLTYP